MNVRHRHGVEARIERAAAACARDGANLTALRREVLALVLGADGPLTAYQLLDLLKESRRRAAPPTVYRALDFLMAHGLVHKIERLNAFVPCSDADHRHSAQFLICRQCGAVAEIEDQRAAKALAHAAEREGFHPNNAVVEIEGTCSACFHPT